MALKFVLRSDEKVIINGAVVSAGDKPGTFYLHNTANFLRGREILKEEQVDTIEKKLYFVIQLMYIFPNDRHVNMVRFNELIMEVQESISDSSSIIEEIILNVNNGNLYKALKICKKLI